MSINTSLTRLLGEVALPCSDWYANPSSGINTPVVAAPMAGASGGALAATVTAAGAFGFLAAGI